MNKAGERAGSSMPRQPNGPLPAGPLMEAVATVASGR